MLPPEDDVTADADQSTENVRLVYTQLCQSYREIDTVRMKLLGLLPLATGAGILFLRGERMPGDLGGIGWFGLAATAGLFAYELHGIKKCGHIIHAGVRLEERMDVYGQFRRRPHDMAGFLSEPFAAAVIYPASMAGWLHIALRGSAASAWWSAGLFVLLMVLSWLLIKGMEWDLAENTEEPYERKPHYENILAPWRLGGRLRRAPGGSPRPPAGTGG
ncbi:hypothetical protein ACFFMN_01175 [Planobispora siamensis]|uniref:Uncharacterized protein n=1 Tax=Planobispora siamensis TaxID=936338 RepID=A0A8J3SFL1_9ACTN|nr:hypothetical protein [Planobispora siamensis]GIH93427.1 hypothetical protein Psi01_40570 [Planobispora siamensis]